MSRIERERETLRKMVSIYCWKKHGQERGKLCAECRELLSYAFKRLSLCPFGEDKPTCKKCPVHCYKPEMREKIKEVMRFSGPRLILYDPFSWLLHEVKEKFPFKGLSL
ncbi:MAG: nitrous oxide-stimulated promoter family protein [Desulfurobacterium sp.]|nr:MAG: nitrous oxide-stimulated promoter family protein [Desulfurobacterium sp.]